MIPTKPLIGNSAESVWHETNRRNQLKQRIVSSPDIGVRESPHGTALFIKRFNSGSGSGSSGKTQYLLKDASYADFYICRELSADEDWNPETDANRFTEGDSDIYIAKPWLLRRSEFDGLTITVPVETLVAGNIVLTDTFWKFTYKSATFRITQQLDAVGGNVISTENEIVLPRYLLGDEIIFADECADLQMQAFGEDITLLSDDCHLWAHSFV